ncbi:MAG: hypothetical protein JWN37_616 [Candidatus Nomurabacteria bacterium]|nr:hypothetical protein [Candidatus Nomurabacteria bacterium]
MKNNIFIRPVIVTAIILVIPLLARFPWTLSDFIIMGALILVVGLIWETILRKVKDSMKRIYFIALLVVVFILVWAELAVGIFGSPFAGS